MGIIFNQQDNRSDLQKRIAAELSEKAKKKHALTNDIPDGVADSAFIEGSKSTTSLAWVWVLIVAFVVVGAVTYIIMGGNQR
jgi:hypothetical protein